MLARNGIAMIMGMAMRSWKMRMPSAMLPCGESISPRWWRILSTMAVLDRENKKPIRIAWFAASPMRSARPQKNANERPTWSAPPTIAMSPDLPEVLERELEADGEEQQDDADLREVCDLVLPLMMENPYGPTMAPVRMKATRGGTLILLKTIPTTSATAKTIRIFAISAISMAVSS